MTFLNMAKVLGRVLKYLVPYWKTVVLAITLTLLATGTRLCQAKFVGWIMELMSNNTFAAVVVSDRPTARPLPALNGDTEAAKGESGAAADVNRAQSKDESVQDGADKKASLKQDEIFQRYFSYENGQSPFMALNYVCLFFLLVMTVMGVCTYFQKYLTDQCGQLAIRDFRNNVFFALQRLPISFFDKMRSGEVLSRSTTDVITASGVFSLLSEFTKNFLIVLGCFVWMFWRDWQMTLVVLFISPLIAIAIGNFGARIGAKTSKLQARLADLSALQFENVSAIRVVKANNKEDYESKRFKDRNEDNYDAQMKVVQVQSMQSPVVELMGIVAIAIVVWFGATRIMQGEVSFSQMTEYWTLMAMTGHPLQVIASFYGSCQNSAAAAVRAFEVIDSTPETVGCGNKVLPAVKGGIEFKDVHFAYEKEKPVLKGINIKIEPGEFVAVVGMNGSGKSTLVNMLERFYAPDSGQIMIDGHDIADVTLESLRSQIGIVFQESVLFRDSIFENVRYGNMEASDEQIRQAITMAGADEFIAKFPDGLDTNVGERGSALSGGQRQRLAVARALVHDPRILILDEYTSGLDAEAEDNLTEVIDKSMKGRTCLVIAHRLATIRYADRIIVMDGGQVAEEGTHDELLAKNGIYRKIFEAQRSA
ncbi:ABC transporter ATP-binding protein [bacterium]|nr:ABC transporter ATP-binding protein [bacterium]